MTRRIYISNLPFSVEEEALESALLELLSTFGQVLQLRLIFEGSTLRPQGLCFAEMGSLQEAQFAIEALRGMIIAGHCLEIGMAIPKICPPPSEAQKEKREVETRRPAKPPRRGGKGRTR
jgi:RNA recognition motif-containing protein